MSHRTEDLTYGKDYWDTLDGGCGYVDSTMWEDIAHTIKEVFGIRDGRDVAGEMSVIDVGCAMGYLVKHLRRRGFDAWGVDLSEYALEHADEQAKSYLRQFDLTKPVGDATFFGRQQFRLVTCLETLEHIDREHAERASWHLWEMLVPGGLALLTICVTGQPGADDDPTHVNVIVREWWDQLFISTAWMAEPEIERQLRGFWLFSAHKGVFVLRKPGG